MILKGALGSTVTIFQLEFMYASYIPSLSFLAQTEAEILKSPHSGGVGGSTHQCSTWVHVCKLYTKFELSSSNRSWDTKITPQWGVEWGWGSKVTIFQLGSMYVSFIPSLSFLAQTEAEIQKSPHSGGGVGGGGQQSQFFNLSSCMQAIFQVWAF